MVRYFKDCVSALPCWGSCGDHIAVSVTIRWCCGSSDERSFGWKYNILCILTVEWINVDSFHVMIVEVQMRAHFGWKYNILCVLTVEWINVDSFHSKYTQYVILSPERVPICLNCMRFWNVCVCVYIYIYMSIYILHFTIGHTILY